MKRFTFFILALFMALLCRSVGADPIPSYYISGQGVWFDDSAYPSDVEFGGNAAVSLSPHISAVGGAYYGVDNSYVRASIGGRITATDVNDGDFSVGVGMQYHASSEVDIRPEGWAPDVSVGWRAWPTQMPKLILIGQASFLGDIDQAFIALGARYKLGAP